MNYTSDITGKTIETKIQTNLQILVLQARLASTPSDTLIQVAEGQGKGPAAASQWQLGQVVKAQIVLQPEQNQLSLQLGKMTIQIPLSDTASIKQDALLQQIAALTAGKGASRPLQLLLEVIQTQPKLELRVQSPNPTPTGTTNPTAPGNTPTPVDSAIKNLIATQRGLAPLLANLVQLTKASNLPQIPTSVLQEARALLENLASVARASTADGVKQALQNSGAFLEAKIANQLQALQNHPSSLSSSLQSDLKGTLLRFQQLLTNLFPGASATATATAATNANRDQAASARR